MNRPIDRNDRDPALSWRVLAVLNLYRVLVPLVLLGLYSLGGARGFAVYSAQLFFGAAIFYLCFGLVSVVLVRRRMAGANVQTILQAAVDMLALILLLHACGGVASGLGVLFLCPLARWRSCCRRGARFSWRRLRPSPFSSTPSGNSWAASQPTSIRTPPRACSEQSCSRPPAPLRSPPAACAKARHWFARKTWNLANLAELSQYIVQHLRESILVVDAADRIRLINESAAEILGDNNAIPGALAGEVSPRLLYSLSTWRQRERDQNAPSNFVAADGARVIQPHFVSLGGAPGPTLIFLEDTSLMAERVQQGKLAALGRLSASIAHEIRNPVGAMSHAGQLPRRESPISETMSAASPTLFKTIPKGSAPSSTMCCNCRGARQPSPRGLSSATGSKTSWRNSAPPCRFARPK